MHSYLVFSLPPPRTASKKAENCPYCRCTHPYGFGCIFVATEVSNLVTSIKEIRSCMIDRIENGTSIRAGFFTVYATQSMSPHQTDILIPLYQPSFYSVFCNLIKPRGKFFARKSVIWRIESINKAKLKGLPSALHRPQALSAA